jgi:maltooligosyltrehalose synthase
LGRTRDIEAQCVFLAHFCRSRKGLLSIRNSIVHTGLKLTLPGVPDIHQGTDLWDLSLVDPDHRRSVDYGARSGLLEQLLELLGRNRQTAILDLLEDWRDGRYQTGSHRDPTGLPPHPPRAVCRRRI